MSTKLRPLWTLPAPLPIGPPPPSPRPAPAPRDNLRGFFEFCFPVLLKRVFGYDDVEASWLNTVTKVGRRKSGPPCMLVLGSLSSAPPRPLGAAASGEPLLFAPNSAVHAVDTKAFFI